jgi:uncharacterized Tic20 family protein
MSDSTGGSAMNDTPPHATDPAVPQTPQVGPVPTDDALSDSVPSKSVLPKPAADLTEVVPSAAPMSTLTLDPPPAVPAPAAPADLSLAFEPSSPPVAAPAPAYGTPDPPGPMAPAYAAPGYGAADYAAPGYPPPSPRSRARHYGLAGAQPPVPGGMNLPAERNWAIGAHLSGFLAAYLALGFLGPLVVLLTGGSRSAYVRRHAVEAINFNLSVLLWLAISAILVIVLIGIPMLLAVGGLYVVASIRGAVAASNGEEYRYPFTIRFIS